MNTILDELWRRAEIRERRRGEERMERREELTRQSHNTHKRGVKLISWVPFKKINNPSAII